MKISIFCRKCNVPFTTVRYYINLGLLVPQKRESQFFFTEEDVKEMQLIDYLKGLSFSVNEIKKYLQIIRFYDERDENFSKNLVPLLSEKKSSLESDILKLQGTIKHLQEKIDLLESGEVNPEYISGIPLSFSPFLACPKCGSLFNISNLEVRDNNIYSGSLACKCGYSASIEDGILLAEKTSDYYTSDEFYVMHYRETQVQDKDFVFFEYMNDISSEVTALIHKSYMWIDFIISNKVPSAKIILIPDLASHYLYKNLNSPYFKDAFIVVSGFSKSTIKSIKSHIDRLAPYLKIIYIANTLYELPVTKGCFDLWIDAISSYNFSFFHGFSFQEKISPYMKTGAAIVGLTKYHECGSKSSKNIRNIFPYSMPNNSLLSTFHNIMDSYAYDILEETIMGFSINPGSYYDYHIIGEKHIYQGFYAVYKGDSPKPTSTSPLQRSSKGR